MTTGGDIRFLQQLDFPAYAVQLDWLMNDQNLIEDGYDLQSAVIVALGTDSLAPVSEPLPDPDATDRRGWWGDMDAEEIWQGWELGCKLWLMSRAKITGPGSEQGSTIAKAEGWTREAMRPFTEHGITSRIDVLADQTGGVTRAGLEPFRTRFDRIDVSVILYRGPDPVVELRYAELWDQLVEGERS